MLKYKLNFLDGGEVSLPVETPNQFAAYQVQGGELFQRHISRWLASQTGAWGHLIGTATTAIDLHYALTSPAAKQLFQAELLEGADLVKGPWNPGIPEGAVT